MACAPQATLPSQAPFLLACSSEISSDRSHGAHGSLALGASPSESPTPTSAPSRPCPQAPLPTLEWSGRQFKGFWDQCLPSPSVEFGGKGTYAPAVLLGNSACGLFPGTAEKRTLSHGTQAERELLNHHEKEPATPTQMSKRGPLEMRFLQSEALDNGCSFLCSCTSGLVREELWVGHRATAPMSISTGPQRLMKGKTKLPQPLSIIWPNGFLKHSPAKAFPAVSGGHFSPRPHP